MHHGLSYKSLLAAALFSSFDAVSAFESKGLAAEATAAEAQLSFRDIPYLEKAFIDTTPEYRKDSIPVGELGVDGGNKDMILKLAEELADGKQGLYDSMLIAHKGKLLFESYYLRGRINLPHYQASATKVYTSLALGRAMELGYLTMADLDKPLVSFMQDLDPKKFVPGAEKITLHTAMTMRSGIRINEDKRTELEKNPTKLKGQGQIQAWLEHSEPITTESQSYSYSSDPDLVMQVIEAIVPGTAEQFIKTELLDKMDITNYSWQSGISGLPSSGDRASMTSRAMVKWGTLAINKGKWHGEQLISAAYLTKATSGLTKPTEDWQPEAYSYGYFWYQTNITVGDKSYGANIAWGGGGQHIIVVEELDLIVTITGNDREDTIMTQVSKAIIPAFIEQP